MKRNILRFSLLIGAIFISCCLVKWTVGGRPKDFSSIQIIPNDYYTRSYLVYGDSSGEIIDKVKLPKRKGVGYSSLRQTGNTVYFDAYPEISTILTYNTQTQTLDELMTLDKKYESINPYSEQLAVIINGGFSGDGESYRSGICYLDESWECLDLESNLHIWTGTTFKDKIYVYADAAYPQFDENDNIIREEKILIYDKEFNQVASIDVNEELNLGRDVIYFYPYQDSLFLLGEGLETGQFTILEVDEQVQVKSRLSFAETNNEARNLCTPLSFFEEDKGNLILELACDKAKGSEGYDPATVQEDNLLLKLDFNHLDSTSPAIKEIGEHRSVGVNFETDQLLTLNRVGKSSVHSVHVYNLDFEFQEVREIEKFDHRLPTLIDFAERKDN